MNEFIRTEIAVRLDGLWSGSLPGRFRAGADSAAVVLNTRSGRLGHLTGANAGGAHAQGLPGTVDDRMDTLQIGIPPAAGNVVSVAHIISVRRAFTTNFALTRHQQLL